MSNSSINLPITIAISVSLLTGLYSIRKWMSYKNHLKYTQPSLQYEIIKDNVSEKKTYTRTILITGGNGFLGTYIVQGLLAKKDVRIVVFDIIIPNQENRIPGVIYIKGNLLNIEHIKQSLSFDGPYSIASVIHVASLVPYLGVPDSATYAINVNGTANLIEAVKEYTSIKSLIYTSSATVVLDKYERNAVGLVEQQGVYPKNHLDVYTTTKEAAEKLVLGVTDNSGESLVTCALRPAAIFGKGDKLLSDHHVAHIDAVVTGEGEVKFDWVSVESVAYAHILAEEVLSTGASINARVEEKEKRRLLSGQVYFIGNNICVYIYIEL